jgi:phosphocarrier protein HPr
MKLKVIEPIFAEAANQLVNNTNQFESKILLKKDHWVIDAKSLLGILALSLQPGQEVEIETEDDKVIESLLELGLFEKIS